MDSGSSSNCCSSRVVHKLALPTIPHPKPYKLQWIIEDEEIIVNTQVTIPISIGKYEENILCDVVPMDVGHVLLGRPWQYDHNSTHDGYTNKITFLHKGNKITLIPLTPEQVKEDEIKIKEKIEKERKQENMLEKHPSQEKKKETKVCMILTPSLAGKYLDFSSFQKHQFDSPFHHGECSK